MDKDITLINKFTDYSFKELLYLLSEDEQFVEDIEKSGIFYAFKDLSIDERKEQIDCNFGNTCRAYIMSRIAFKHLYRLSIEIEEQIDPYWIDRIKKLRSSYGFTLWMY